MLRSHYALSRVGLRAKDRVLCPPDANASARCLQLCIDLPGSARFAREGRQLGLGISLNRPANML